MDMALTLIADLCGDKAATATGAEYEWHKDPSWDPFAEIHGLI